MAEQKGWQPLPTGTALHPGITQSVFWLRVRLADSTRLADSLFILLPTSLVDSLDAYQEVRGQRMHYMGGDRRPFSVRTIPNRHFVIPLRSGAPVLIRIASYDGLHEPVQVELVDRATLDSHRVLDSFLFGTYFGMLLFVALFAIVFAVVFKEANQITFAAYTLFFALWSLVFHGFADQLLWSNDPMGNQVMMASILCFSLLLVLFAMQFLNLRTSAPSIDRPLGWVLIATIVVLPVFIFLDAYRWFFTLYIIATLACVVLILGAGLLCAWRRNPDAILFLSSWSLLLLGATLYMMKAMGILPSNFITENTLFFGTLFQIVVLCIGITLRFHRAQQLANRNLEKQVLARTTALEIANEQLRGLSQQDPLTGLSNRRHFEELFHLQAATHKRQGEPLSVLMLDIDFFKQYNDCYGHVQGDHCLQSVAKCIAQALPRDSDFCARYGGEEFIVCLTSTDSQGAGVVATRLRDTLKQASIAHEQSTVSPYVTVSIGLSSAHTQGPWCLEILKEKADQALYKAKRTGRDRYCVAE